MGGERALTMSIFRRKAPVRPHGSSGQSGQAQERPSWMRDGVQVALLEGSETLEVVGESHYQTSLWRLAGARPGPDHVRVDICAVLVAEDGNPHDAEMGSIRQACLTKWGKVPVLDTYRQMAIRQQKAHDYQQALWWAERGIALYSNSCARPEAVTDLGNRAEKYRSKLVRRSDDGRG